MNDRVFIDTNILYSEDMQNNPLIKGTFRVVNPFLG